MSHTRSREKIRRVLAEIRVDQLHYMAPRENAPLILARGILSYNNTRTIPHASFAKPSVQQLRRARILPTGRPVHDYVPLYISTHTPMQYVVTKPAPTKGREAMVTQEDLLFFEVDALRVFQMDGVVFADGNAASSETHFYSDPADLVRLDWESIRLPNAYPQCYDPEWQRKKAAEVLVPEAVPVEFITRVVVCDDEASDRFAADVEKLREERPSNINWAHLADLTLFIDPTYYF